MKMRVFSDDEVLSSVSDETLDMLSSILNHAATFIVTPRGAKAAALKWEALRATMLGQRGLFFGAAIECCGWV